MKDENKKRINKLVVPLTLKSVSLFSAFTMITTGMSGCKKNDKNDMSSLNNDITTSDTSEIENSSIDTTDEIENSSTQKEESSEIESNGSSSINSSKKPSTNNSQITSNNSSISQPNNSTTTSNQSGSNTPSVPDTTPSVPQTSMPSTLTADNINNVEVFKYFADKLNRESFPNLPIFYYTYDYNGQDYTTDGEKEMQFMLALLNYQYIDNTTLKTLFGNESLDKIKQYGSFLDDLAYLTAIDKKVYNFDDYLIDKNLGNYLLNAEKEYINASNGQTENFKNIALNYFVNKSGNYYYKNVSNAVDRYMYLLAMKSLKYNNNVQLRLELTTISYDISTSYDNMVLNMYDNIHSKTKIMINN